MVHALNLSLKNICATRNTEGNHIAFEKCNWITYVSEGAIITKNFIMNYSVRLAMLNEPRKLETYLHYRDMNSLNLLLC